MGVSECDDFETCVVCGSMLDWTDCAELDCDGGAYHDCGEDTCCCAEPEPNTKCTTCGGRGGFLSCTNSKCGEP